MPNWKHYIRARLAPLALRAERELEIVEELALHLEAVYETALARGATEAEALARALAQIKDAQLLECELSRAERFRDCVTVYPTHRKGGMHMETLRQDLRYGVRMLLRQPALAVIAILTLALGIGANTAIFSVVDAVLLKPLPYGHPEQLTLIWASFEKMAIARAPASGTQWNEIRERSRTLAELGAIWVGNGTLLGETEPEQIKLGSVTANFFDVLEAKPFLGRTFQPEEQGPGTRRAIVLSHGLWQRRYGADANLIGRAIRVNGREATVVGVMPREFQLHFPADANVPAETQAWIPFGSDLKSAPRDLYYLRLVGRLKPDVTIEQAQAEMPSIAEQLREQYQEYASENLKLELVPLHGDAVRDLRPALRVLMAAVLFVLLIACANVANLLLVRATGRQQELAVRLALGAQPSRIVRQLLTESVLLALAGGALGLLLARWGVQMLLQLAPENLPRFQQVSLDSRVLLFTVAASLLTGIVFGLIPALTASRTDLNATLKEGGRSNQTARHRVRDAFVVAQVAAALVLLIGAGLLMKSFWRLQAVEPGFDPTGVLTMRMLLPFETYPENSQRAAFYQQVLERVRQVPGVESVAAITRTPLLPGGPSGTVSGENSVVGPADTPVEADRRWITPAYFQAMGITLVKGRAFTEADTAGAAAVAIVDESFAHKHWPNQDVIGKRIKLGRHESNNPWMTVVGVVRHVKSQRLEAASNVQTYMPFYQDPSFFSMSLVVRTRLEDPLTLRNAVRAAIQSVERNQPVFYVKTMQQFVDESLAQRRLALWLMSVFAAVALLLAAIGLYGVMSYAVSQRTHELGLRLALGAQPRDVLRLVLRQGMTLVFVGASLGLLSAFGLTRLMQTVLFGVSASDAPTYAVIVVLLLFVALLACWLPARRATRVDPLIALRHE